MEDGMQTIKTRSNDFQQAECIDGVRILAKDAPILAALDGLSIKSASLLPHPCDLARYSDAGLYTIDARAACFRLTSRGREITRIHA